MFDEVNKNHFYEKEFSCFLKKHLEIIGLEGLELYHQIRISKNFLKCTSTSSYCTHHYQDLFKNKKNKLRYLTNRHPLQCTHKGKNSHLDKLLMSGLITIAPNEKGIMGIIIQKIPYKYKHPTNDKTYWDNETLTKTICSYLYENKLTFDFSVKLEPYFKNED